MLVFIIIALVFVIIISLEQKYKFKIDFKTFFKKGFKKIDNAFGLLLYCGKQGKGKTFSATKFCKEQIEEHGYILITNIKSLSNNIQNSIYEIDLMKIIDRVTSQTGDNKYIIFYDEIFTTLEKTGTLKREFLSFLSQLRKRQILLISTAQEWLEINVTLRRYCRFQIECNMISVPLLKMAVCVNLVKDGDLLHWDNFENDFVAPVIQTNIFKANTDIIALYDTFETIETSGVLLNKSR